MRRFLDLLLPPCCAGCGVETVALCAECRRPMSRRLDEPPGTPIGLASSQPDGLAQFEWCASFSGPARACLHTLKYDGELRLAAPLAALMASRWWRVGIGGDLLVPVPVHTQRRRERGFDQAELLAGEIGRLLRLPVCAALERTTRTRAQHQLGRGARAENVGGAFRVRHGMDAVVGGRWVVVVDDVMTTGATLSASAAALRQAGAAAVSALTLARER
jgi:ComF family protein